MKKADTIIEVKGSVTAEDKVLTWDACSVEGGRPYIDHCRIKSINLKVEAGEVAVMGAECYVQRRKNAPIGTATTRWIYFPVQHLQIRSKNMCSERPDLGFGPFTMRGVKKP